MKESCLHDVRKECGGFLEATTFPFYTLINVYSPPISKIKIRTNQHNERNNFGICLNDSLSNLSRNLYRRTVFTEPMPISETPTTELGYVFIPGKFRYFHSTVNHTIRENFDDLILKAFNWNVDIFEILTSAYSTTDSLAECVEKEQEVGFYGMPYFYVVKTRYFHSYEKLLNDILNDD